MKSKFGRHYQTAWHDLTTSAATPLSKSSSCAKNPNNLHLHNGWVFSLWNLVPPPYIITIGHWDLWTTCSTVY